MSPAPADSARVGYNGAADAWAGGASLAYVPLARHLVAACPEPLLGAIALDAGAGTGAAGAALHERGANVVSSDLQGDMLRLNRCRTDAAVADIIALPFRAGAFDVVVAAFVLNHLDRPGLGLTEMARVCRHGGAVLASSFAATRAPVKTIVDNVAAAHGWVVPEWYETFRRRAAQLSSAEHMAEIAHQAGLGDVAATETEIDIGLDDPHSIARYRLGMPQLAAFVSALTEARRRAFQADVIAAIAASGEPLRPAVVELVARAA